MVSRPNHRCTHRLGGDRRTRRGGTPVTGIGVGSEVEEREDSSDITKGNGMGRADMVELAIDILEPLPGAFEEDALGEGTELTGIMPELEGREVGREGFDRSPTAEPDHSRAEGQTRRSGLTVATGSNTIVGIKSGGGLIGAT